MLAFNTLYDSFARYYRAFRDVFFVSIVVVGINGVYVKRGKQSQQFVEILVFPRTKTICERYAGIVVDRPPKPILLRFIVNK
jgi:hypothetical protein